VNRSTSIGVTTLLQGVQTRADLVGDPDLGVGPFDVVADGLLAEPESRRNVAIGQVEGATGHAILQPGRGRLE
jgi:hypothetical protein